MEGYFKSEIEKESIPIRPQYEFANTLAAPSASEIDELSERCQSLEQRVASLNDSYETLKKREVELTEWRWVLTEAGGFFDRVVYIHPINDVLSFANLHVRPMGMLTRSVSLSTMMRLHCYETWSSSLGAKMVTFRAKRFPQ